jgi:PAS domain S-box-containing protein
VEAIILVITPEGRVLRSNRYLSTISGHDGEEVSGREWCGLLLPEADRPRGRDMVRQALASGTARSGVLGLAVRKGGVRAVAWSAIVLVESGGMDSPGGPPSPARRVVILGHDVTDLKEAQQRALQAERLAAIGQMMTGLAHESRNALQRSQSSLEMLRWQVQDRPRAVELLGRIQKAQDDLVRLYEDVRGYAAPINLRPGPVNLSEVWREAWAQVALLQPARDAGLREETSGVSLVCSADRFHLVSVFRNLFDNSFAACDGPVRVEVWCRETRIAAQPALRVAVRDNGPGLTAEQRQNIFQPFYTTKTRGTGLGMAIAKRIIEAHGGQIAVGDVPSGTEIVITLPRSRT